MEICSESILADSLGLYGWRSLEPVVFASLASEMPMLLIGNHGSGKSMAIERIAAVLGLEFRSYNASLINYDDLTGIPVPSEDYKKLNYLACDCSIWDAQAVFIDEINRTKPELQNKLFPIIYDRRIQGRKLDKLRFRWAAMNPCSAGDGFSDDSCDGAGLVDYAGAYPLDPALADRFPYVVEVPVWKDLSKGDKQAIFNGFGSAAGTDSSFKSRIMSVINEIREMRDSLSDSFKKRVGSYISALCDVLNSSFGYISSRRAVMMYEAFLHLHCAIRVLNGGSALLDDADDSGVSDVEDIEMCAKLHIRYVIPDIASGKRIDLVRMQGIVLQALAFSRYSDDAREIMTVVSKKERLVRTLKLRDRLESDFLSDVVPECVFSMGKFERRAAALISYLVLRRNADVHATVMESLMEEIRPIFNPASESLQVVMRKRKISDRVNSLIAEVGKSRPYGNYANYFGNLLSSFLPDGFSNTQEVDAIGSYSMELFDMFPEAFEGVSSGSLSVAS